METEDQEINKKNLMPILFIVMFLAFLLVAGFAWQKEQQYIECAVKFNNCSNNCLAVDTFDTERQGFLDEYILNLEENNNET